MKTEMTTTSVTLACSSANTTKLASLLTLAAGAITLPQTSNADIIYTDLNASPQRVGYSGGASPLFQLTLPGSVQFGFFRYQYSVSTTLGTINFRTVLAGQLGPGANAGLQVTGGLAANKPFGASWDAGGFLTAAVQSVGWASTYIRVPSANYDHRYLAWQFVDDSPSGGGATRYGWIEISLSMNFYPTGPNVTIWGYAWDNTGAKPAMGQTTPVPEPSSAAFLVFGAMALGARGLRNWRQNRETIRNS